MPHVLQIFASFRYLPFLNSLFKRHQCKNSLNVLGTIHSQKPEYRSAKTRKEKILRLVHTCMPCLKKEEDENGFDPLANREVRKSMREFQERLSKANMSMPAIETEMTCVPLLKEESGLTISPAPSFDTNSDSESVAKYTFYK